MTTMHVEGTVEQQAPPRHKAVVLFYKYWPTTSFAWWHWHQQHYGPKLLAWQKATCQHLGCDKGRVLLAAEGINGTLSAPSIAILQQYMERMEQFDLVDELGLPPPSISADNRSFSAPSDPIRLFRNIDWKFSTSGSRDTTVEPFPDLKIRWVREIVSTGGTVTVDDVATYGGIHLSPDAFHQALLHNRPNDIVLLDIRNTYEHAIGHFCAPNNSGDGDGDRGGNDSSNAATSFINKKALHPDHMVNFSSLDNLWTDANVSSWKDKQVLMYCTGGIRCEKASALLRKRGVHNVAQLAGGIHRYLEQYGDQGLFVGRNFVFDQRVALSPAECQLPKDDNDDDVAPGAPAPHDTTPPPPAAVVVGRCVECDVPYDAICGSRVCTVCRDLVLICPSCARAQREYHCERHQAWKSCYFTFLEIFNTNELDQQCNALRALRDELTPPCQHKHKRRTLTRQMQKV